MKYFIIIISYGFFSPVFAEDVVLKHVSLYENEAFVTDIDNDNIKNPKYYLKGRVYNYSKDRVGRYKVKLVFLDCEEIDKCIVIGRDFLHIDEAVPGNNGVVPIPPSEARDFKRGIKDIPTAIGNLRFSYELEYPTGTVAELLFGERKNTTNSLDFNPEDCEIK